MITAVAALSDDRLVIGTIDGRLGVVDPADRTVPAQPHADDATYDLALTPDGHHALCIGKSGSLSLWDMHTGARRWHLPKQNLAPQAAQWQVRFTSLAFSPDGSLAALYFVDDDMYGGLGILALQLATGKSEVLFDPDRGTKSSLSEQIGDGLRGSFTRPDGHLVVVTTNGTELLRPPAAKDMLQEEAPPVSVERPAQKIGAGLAARLDPSLRLGSNDPFLLEVVDAAGAVRARFSLEEPVVAARISVDEHIIVASTYGHLAFLRLVESERPDTAEG